MEKLVVEKNCVLFILRSFLILTNFYIEIDKNKNMCKIFGKYYLYFIKEVFLL